MAKNFKVIDFTEEKSKKIAEIMSNKTCRKILDYLKENSASETDIAKELSLPLSTVHYNLQNLRQNELIDIKDFYWSNKGNKVNIYKATENMILLANKKASPLHLKLIIPLCVVIALIAFANISYFTKDSTAPEIPIITPIIKELAEKSFEFNRFESNYALTEAFNKAYNNEQVPRDVVLTSAGASIVSGGRTSSVSGSSKAIQETDFSETNVQVEGVDEADIIKTDGKYIYIIAQNKLIIADAYPAYNSKIISRIYLDNFNPTELFIEGDRLLVFGSSNYNSQPEIGELVKYYPRQFNMVSVKLFDISNKENPELLRTVEFEGNYLTSRKIGSDVYFVVNYHLNVKNGGTNDCRDIIPFYKEDEMLLIAKCTDIGYIENVYAQNLITIISISITDENKEIEKEVFMGSGENVYASAENIYIAQTYNDEETEKTIITKFKLDDGEIEFAGTGKVQGYILNQFSMDEYDNYFRIATTKGEVWNQEQKSINNLYVLDKNLDVVGELEGLAPGEKIYSVRYMGERAYMVTFKKVDPLFVIDLSNPRNPNVLGKLKIPGYSDYLHPYDKNHIIGIGKDTTEQGDFALYQGIKIAIFDVSDVNNPIEMHKEIIGERGTNSEALYNHKAFLFNREKEVLVIPVNIQDNQDNFREGVYVYNINLKDGFELRGRIEIENPRRNLYIENILYTMTENKLQLSSILTTVKIRDLVF